MTANNSVPLKKLYLIFKAPQDLFEHILQVNRRICPASDSVTEEDKVGNHACRIQTDHQAHALEGGLLLFIVSDIPDERYIRNKLYPLVNLRLVHQGLTKWVRWGAMSAGHTRPNLS